jgi:hypothetical protein
MGSKKKKTTQTYKPPSWVEGASRQAIGIGQRIASQEYKPYEGERVAGLSENEQIAMQMARDTAGVATPYYEEGAALARRGTKSWADLDQAERDKYMNPYIKGALDPAAREIREQGAREAMALDSRAASMDAFGGSRAALMRSEAQQSTLQGISDLYGKGYAQAYESAVGIWGDERTRDMQASGRLVDIGTAMQNAAQTDISTLMTTGATDRDIQQRMLDFDYGQWVEARDWDFRALGAIIASLEGTKGSYTTTQTTKSKESGGELGQALGIAATLVGAYFTGGASLAAGASDERLKDNITYLFTSMGRKIYSWTWNSLAVSLGIDDPTIGVLAQENPDISFEGPHGYLMVDYAKLAE